MSHTQISIRSGPNIEPCGILNQISKYSISGWRGTFAAFLEN